jgi:hydrogenase nickel incorporation protein HypB
MMEIQIVKKVLDANDKMAADNRKFFEEKGVAVINVMSSPGSGKTALLVETLKKLGSELPAAVIVGDICTTNDAERLAAAEVQVSQICTDQFGGDCHLAAHVIREAADGLDLDAVKLLIIENVGNLVCPAEFDIGADASVVVLSVTEGEDKPLKYPLMFQVCEVALLNKIDLLPHLNYDRQAALDNILAINPQMTIFETSAQTCEGLPPWLDWLRNLVKNR